MSRPFKVWTADRKIRRSLTAVSLSDLITKGKEKLGFAKGEKVEVVLEEDGTLVDDEDYFHHLNSDTTLILLKRNEHWSASWTEDEPEISGYADYVEDNDEVDGTRTLQQIATLLRGDVARITFLTVEELEVVVNASSATLIQLLGSSYTVSEVNRLQAACQRYIDERADAKETALLMRRLSECPDQQMNGGGDTSASVAVASGRKRKKRK